ncbi:hypothetical protein RND81_09G263300 [Saponaria officinalis]|uniref:RRM domain-containing protein n=1 Tax=Saponaria officinalis TaxID=3572 RepID=A0AAW1IQS1_SAPOF
MRERSYSPSPPRGSYSRKRRSPSPRGRYSGHGRDPSTSLLVRNLSRDCRPEDLRRPFGKFGALKDIYLPRDYYTGAPRGFGFVQYVDPDDAADAKYQMDGQVFHGRELTVVFAEENRKKPLEMRSRERTSHRGQHGRRRSPARHSCSRSRSPRYSHSPPAKRGRPRSHSYSPSTKQRQHSRSVTPKERKPSRERSYSRESRGRSYSRSPPPRNSRSRSRSPYAEEHSGKQKRDKSAGEDGL